MARKILLADDSVTAQNMGRKILTDAGYEVVTVNNGSAALKRILEQRPDLIVLDVYMPGYSGLEVCQRIKENKETSRIPILLTVGKLEPFKPEEARRARADAFVVKPFEASELLAALTKLEDKVVPQGEPYKPGRFAKAAAALEADAQAEEDTSWKARLRIPSGKKRDPEPEVDYAATQGKGFRDLRVEETGKKPRAKAKESEDTFERPMPAGLPSDITPEEIAAITAAAARLKGTGPVADSKEPTEEVSPAPQVVTPEVAAEESAPVTFASAPETQGPEAPSESQSSVEALAVESVAEPRQGDVEIAASEEGHKAEEGAAQSEVVVATQVEATVETVPSAPLVVPEPSSTAAQSVTEAPAELLVGAEPVAPEVEAAAPVSHETPAAAASVENTPAPAATAPADDEVMAALQSLMPVPDSVTPSSTVGSNGSGQTLEISSAFAVIATQVDPATVKAHIAGPRWMAEEVALSAGEATLLLEREMEQAYSAAASEVSLPASAAAPVVGSQPDSVVAFAEPAPGVPAPAVPQSEAAETTVYAMASAAGAGEVVAVAASASAVSQEAAIVEPAPPLPDTQDATPVASTAAVETALRITEVESPAAVPAPAPQLVPEPEIPQTQTLETQISETQNVEGADEMANWKNIRDSIAGAAPKRAPAKEEVAEVEAATTESATPAATTPEVAPSAASDPKAIASIVDSVLAELRPKIVEEIAKKLSAEPRKE